MIIIKIGSLVHPSSFIFVASVELEKSIIMRFKVYFLLISSLLITIVNIFFVVLQIFAK